MRMLEQLPALPEGEGTLWTHNTHGEHALKFAGTERAFNPLRASELRPTDGSPITEIEHFELIDMMQGFDHHIVFVDRQGLPKDESEQPPKASGRIAGGVAGLSVRDRCGMTIRVNELVVHPDLRGNKIASFILGKLSSFMMFGAPPLTEMTFDTSQYEVEPWFLEKLRGIGFRHEDPSGSPSMWLPGKIIANVPNLDLGSPEDIDRLIEKMPPEFDGALVLYPETNPRTSLYHQATLVGHLQRIEGTREYDHEFDQGVQGYRLFDARDIEIDHLEGVTDREATIALLNNYELVQ
ncbi:MAG TPA: hypothetical protein VK712_02195 [Verrucomicrobiae bacterium]|jgi:hypothetical protein|nr:hypothetical protein [Verrucomicrobiae bacterium]